MFLMHKESWSVDEQNPNYKHIVSSKTTSLVWSQLEPKAKDLCVQSSLGY